MTEKIKRRDYTIGGVESLKAMESGLVQAEWYTSPIPRERLRELMKRKDGPAIRDTFLWLALLGILGYLCYVSWGTWWMLLTYFIYGNVYIISAVSRWHECTHGTAFKTQWMNDAVNHIASFLLLIQTTKLRWSHVRHHSDTIIVGRDPEIIAPKPPSWIHLFPIPLHFSDFYNRFKSIVLHACGQVSQSEQDFIEKNDIRQVIREARIYIFLLLAIWIFSVVSGNYFLGLLVAWPLVYGRVLDFFCGITQHLGLHEDVLDHRLNTRTFKTNFFIEFIYWNINYHLEHHMFPMVPYHALKKLHHEIKADCPPAHQSFYSAIKEAWPAMWKARKDPTYSLERPLPPTARPYQYHLKKTVIHM